MPKSLAKVQKKLSKKKGKLNSLHENSRDAQKLRRASGREDKLAREATARGKQNQYYLNRVAHFQKAGQTIAFGPTGLDFTWIQNVIKDHLSRHLPEISILASERRPGRPQSNREDQLKELSQKEEREYDTGFWVPDMLDEGNVKRLEEWNGEWTSMAQLGFIRVLRGGELRKSSFPPKGQS
ncbi:MAG: hypothetical protein MMC33_001686 [Icmadophila ericetorum]|nr:hypothetical protein [Icmadophila ericetorum]